MKQNKKETQKDALVGQTVDGFVVDELIAEGSFARVYKVHAQGLSQPYAMKLAKDSSSKSVERLEKEMKLLDRTNSGNIPKIVAQNTGSPQPYIVMEYIPESLDARMGGMGWKDAVQTAVGVLDALDYAHNELGIVHRDIAPKNIMFKNGKVQLIDFNLSDSLDKKVEDSIAISRDASVSMPHLVGTRLYAAPEQVGFIDDKVSERSDIYAVGTVLYQMLTGEVPYGDMPAPSKVGLPKWLDMVVAKARAKHPSQRYASAREMADVLRAGLAGRYDGPTLGERLAKLSRGLKTVARNLIIGGMITGAVMGGAFGIRSCAQRYQAQKQSFYDDIKHEDKGRLAYFTSGSEIKVIRVQDLPDKDKGIVYKIPGADIEALLWSSDGKAVYYLNDVGNIFDTKHQIVRYDLAAGKSAVIVDLRQLYKAKLPDDDIQNWVLDNRFGRIEFQLGTGEWYSIKEDGTGVTQITEKHGSDQKACLSGRHKFEPYNAGKSGMYVRIRNPDDSYDLENGKDPVYTPHEAKPEK